MKNAAAALILFGLSNAASADVGKDEVKKLLQSGLGESSILKFIAANAPAAHLSSDDIIELKSAGASEVVLRAMISASFTIIDLPPPVRVVSETPSARHFWPTIHPVDPASMVPQKRLLFTYEAWAGASRPYYAEDYPCGAWRGGCDPAPCPARRSAGGCSGTSYRSRACWRR